MTAGVAAPARRLWPWALFAAMIAAAGFSLWAFVSKLALALSAATVLPLLQMRGFQPGAVNSAQALTALSLTYAAVPCGLKAAALLVMWRSPIGRD